MSQSFWESFVLFLIFLPLALIWGFALWDIFRRDDLSGGWKVLWTVIVFVLPLLGTLVYLIVRPAGATREERAGMATLTTAQAPSAYVNDDQVRQLQMLSDLHGRGTLSDEEYVAERARIVGEPAPPPAESGGPLGPVTGSPHR